MFLLYELSDHLALLKVAGDYSPTNFLKIFSAVPVGTSPACRGTHSNAPVFGFVHLSCLFPFRARTHPAFLRLSNKSDVFIKHKNTLSSKDGAKVTKKL